jgi:hypothetical protein
MVDLRGRMEVEKEGLVLRCTWLRHRQRRRLVVIVT